MESIYLFDVIIDCLLLLKPRIPSSIGECSLVFFLANHLLLVLFASATHSIPLMNTDCSSDIINRFISSFMKSYSTDLELSCSFS